MSENNIKHKAILMFIYSAGLRISEVAKLKLEDNRYEEEIDLHKRSKREEGLGIRCFLKWL
ncbi:hypothetical protein CW714_07370 [Methanophagales archaeon]|nr:MAG: hypothetical protein CW714_07370 [Methanophagales archaeon]